MRSRAWWRAVSCAEIPPLQPGPMPRSCVGARLLVDGETVMDMSPIVGCGVSRIDVERLHRIDDMQHALDLGPAVHAQQNVAAGADEWQRLIGFTGGNGAHDVGAR